MNQRYRPAVSEPVFLILPRRPVEAGDLAEPLEFLLAGDY